MAGIGRFPSGYKATAGKVYWAFEDDYLFFVLELENTDVADYGSDIGIDPHIRSGDPVTYTVIDTYCGLWARTGTEEDQATLDIAVGRVLRNRRFADEVRRFTSEMRPCTGEVCRFTSEVSTNRESLPIWLQELATQTRLPVMFGGNEIAPKAVSTLNRFSPEIREWFLEDLSRLEGLGDEGFENLVADILEDMGYTVHVVSPTRRKDGGVDIAGWPRSGMPYLIAIQVKHHCDSNKTVAGDVRDFAGTLNRNPVFRFGLLVTNTTFTDDARHFQEPLANTLRLRDIEDIKRWLRGDLSGEAEWKEIPDEVSLGLGVSFPVKPKEPREDDAFWKHQKRSSFDQLRDLLG